MQETNGRPKLAGYITYTDPSEKSTATLVKSSVAATQHLTPQRGCEHVLVEIHSREVGSGNNIFILNAYCRPSKKEIDFEGTLRDCAKEAKTRPILLLGDFNAPHTQWGYQFQSKRGKQLLHVIEQHNLTILNEPNTPTRMGTSTVRDSSPDLSLLKGDLDATWLNKGLNLGSDHDIICISIKGPDFRAKIGQARITDWDRLRRRTEIEIDETGRSYGTRTYQEWAKRHLEWLHEYTQKIDTTVQTPYVDSKLAHIWEARHALTKRWKRQRHNRKLRKRIQELNRQAAEHAAQLCKENWMKLCDGLQGTLSTRKTWNLLRHLIDPLNTKSGSNRNLTRTMNNYQGDSKRLMEDLKNRYLKTEKGTPTSPYTGLDNPDLDQPFTDQELMAAIDESNQASAPGRDTITYKLLNNLSDKSRRELLGYANTAWRSGTLPKEWKEAEVRFIPKPGKTPHIDNLRPISLTSCVGKVIERMVLKRLQRHLDSTDQMPLSMYGFREHLSTQDILLQLNELVIKKSKTLTPRAILALDLKGAFDNVTHESILRNLNTTGCGVRTYEYIRDFLRNRMAIIKIGEEMSEPIELGDRGTPQGSVLSPMLFNLALLPLPALLGKIDGIDHALYADDITIWTTRAGSDAWIEETLQSAAETVHEYAKSCGLSCAPQKSELLVIRPRQRKEDKMDIRITIDATDITPSNQAKILGLTFQENGKAGATLRKLKSTSEQVLSMIRRITNRRRGLKEDDALSLVQAFVISRIVYSAPYLQLLKNEQEQLDVIIRKATKLALGIPICSSTEKILKMAKHNTVGELAEAHLSNQRVRLSQTKAGRAVLAKIGWQEAYYQERGPIPKNWMEKMNSKPLPKNMKPGRNEGRREARAKAINKSLGEGEGILYTDASLNKLSSRAVVAVSAKDKLIVGASVITPYSDEAEEVAIAIALTQPNAKKIVTDSQKAYANYRKGWVSSKARNILAKKEPPQHKVELIWVPAHSSVEGNEYAHQQARELNHRAEEQEHQPITGYKDLVHHYRERRKFYPEPHPSLNRAQQVIYRQIQAGSFPHPYIQNKFYPERYKKECPICKQLGTLQHIIGVCNFSKRTPPPLPPSRNDNCERWETLLASPALEEQLRLISRGQEYLDTYGAREEGTTPSGT